MNRTHCFTALLLLAACSNPGTPTSTSEDIPAAGQEPLLQNARTYHPLNLPNLDDNVRNDTLLIYTTHALGNGEFVMAARNVEETREGLRLYLYKPRADSSADVLAVSKPAYDSEVMLPTYFSTGDTADGTIILANYGGLESWGQNVFWLKNGHFRDLGWLDVAERTFKVRMDSLQQWRTTIAPLTNVNGANGQFDLTFQGDSLMIYDDLQGGREVMLPTSRIRYRYDGRSMVLLVDGKPRTPAPL
ncbi:MAG: hypothetical protein JST45_01335 [Bacteroidetes bacterium]|nr:hypothetical protein [Bacteroidota bacterium]